ncbi:NUDIX hydrolase [Rossellomorea vietnamensis]|uniref:NUDIX hydrolase n=1 Tax=Rossellomorea vietnamensis TaxID=218284 RepID=A0A5D4KB21_9BACI|nr:NUDIX hydrolase [Rossellomorea vietnamensis]TYR74518.1 NUDIX hydrolase [Rossellomorea vietnamensis]
MFNLGAFAIILDEDKRVLLCHRRDYDLWNLPGGGVEKNESPWEAVIREVKEEIGLEVEIEKVLGLYNKPAKNNLVFSFLCKKIGGKLTLTDEADKIDWFHLSEIPNNIPEKQRERIFDFFQHSDVVMKNQSGPSFIESQSN